MEASLATSDFRKCLWRAVYLETSGRMNCRLMFRYKPVCKRPRIPTLLQTSVARLI